MSDRQTVIPVLVYRDIAAVHDHLVTVFGLEPGGVDRDGEGRAVHGEVRQGGQVIWLHRVSAEHGVDSPASLPAVNGGVVVMVDDADAHYERVRAAGARIDYEPADMPYGLREYGARDPEGGHWSFAAPLP